ncbi:hypothetical protein EDB83DRAFT_1624814 [Lactarius deliciosus]|nr:hypothetical protein EDB83DRAFT_1624814 [Lactarius deliciosus]
MVSVFCGGLLETFLNPLSCLIFSFLLDSLLSEQPKQELAACLQHCEGWNHVFIQNIHESLLCIGFCNGCGRPEPQFTMYKRVPLSKLSITLSHAALVVVGSARELNGASTVTAVASR